jgi:hypothetical protein
MRLQTLGISAIFLATPAFVVAVLRTSAINLSK